MSNIHTASFSLKEVIINIVIKKTILKHLVVN